MAAMESQGAVTPPTLRWNQFSLRGLLLFTLFVAILLSILAVGRKVRVYNATLWVARGNPSIWRFPSPALKYFSDATEDLFLEVAGSDSVMEAATQSLQRQGVDKIDYEDVSCHALRKRAAITGVGKVACRFEITITALSSDPEVSRTIAITLYKTWVSMIPKLAPTVKQRYLERAKSELSGSDFRVFESEWRAAEERGDFSAVPVLSTKKVPSLIDFYCLLGGPVENAVVVAPIYPYWNSCLAIAGLWLALGIIAFGIDLWRRFRAYLAENETSLGLLKC